MPNTTFRAGCNCVYGNVARVVYSRTFPSMTTPRTGRLNKSPHTVHAIANRHSTTVVVALVSPECAYSVSVLLAPDVFFAISTNSQSAPGLVAFSTPTTRSVVVLPVSLVG